MLNKVKLLLGLTDNTKDELITLLIEASINEAINYTHNDNLTGYDNVICEMVVWKYNRLGTEGVSSEDYSGVTFNYASDYPEAILRQLRANRKVMTL